MVTWGSYDHMITWGSYVAPSAATNAGGAAAWGLLWPPAIRRHWEVTLWENVVFLRWFLWIYLLLVNVIPDYAAEFLSRAISRTSPRKINGEHVQGDLDSVRVIPISVPKRKKTLSLIETGFTVTAVVIDCLAFLVFVIEGQVQKHPVR